jgi:hypothetical protein
LRAEIQMEAALLFRCSEKGSAESEKERCT